MEEGNEYTFMEMDASDTPQVTFLKSKYNRLISQMMRQYYESEEEKEVLLGEMASIRDLIGQTKKYE